MASVTLSSLGFYETLAQIFALQRVFSLFPVRALAFFSLSVSVLHNPNFLRRYRSQKEKR